MAEKSIKHRIRRIVSGSMTVVACCLVFLCLLSRGAGSTFAQCFAKGGQAPYAALTRCFTKGGRAPKGYPAPVQELAEAALDRYERMTEYESDRELVYIRDGAVDAEALTRRVLENNAEFLSGRGDHRYAQMEDEIFSVCMGALIDDLDRRLEGSVPIDREQLDQNLDRLTLVDTTDQGFARLLDDFVRISVNVQTTLAAGGEEHLMRVIAHETNHLAQLCSREEKEAEGYAVNRGLNYQWSDLPFQALSWTWFQEASAEKLAQAETFRNERLEVYPDWIRALDIVAGALDIEDEEDTGLLLAELGMQGDLDLFFRLFHAQSREEKVEIIEMMFSLEILLNCPDGWYDANQISDRAAYAQQLQEAVDGTLEQVSKKSDCIFDQNVS